MMYRFKYLPNNTVVYAVTLSQPPGHSVFVRQRGFLTQKMKSTSDERHVVVAFQTDSVMKYKLETILQQQRYNMAYYDLENIPAPVEDEPVKLQVHVTKIGDLKDHCDLMSLPLLVYTNVFCDISTQLEVCETFFYQKVNDTKR